MNYIYLDHNIVDRIDTVLKDAFPTFLDNTGCIPVVSAVSLGEIERGNQPERVKSNINSLLSVGSKFILDTESKVVVAALNKEDIYELLSSKNQLIAATVAAVNETQFYLDYCSSKDELISKIEEVLPRLKSLLDRFKKFENIPPSKLPELIDSLEILISEYVPEKCKYFNILRNSLNVDAREINNLKPKDLWNKLETEIQKSRNTETLYPVGSTVKQRIYFVLAFLNAIGYWSDNQDRGNRQLAFNYDNLHAIYGSFCCGFISSDKRFLKRLSAAYFYLSIQTKIYHYDSSKFTELIS